ncbi:MAG: hypothetical protein MK095_05380, partial [Phycisphaerales bacterium]|nr:hypothetical protein [Phycisphaerales bacterium]
LDGERILIDGEGNGKLHATDNGTRINIGETMHLLRGGILQLNAGTTLGTSSRTRASDVDRLLNFDGFFLPGSGTVDVQYTQSGNIPLPTFETASATGTLILSPDQTPTFNQSITLGGTILIDFSGRNVDPGSTHELIRFNGGSTRNTGIQCTGLPANTFLRVRRETDDRTSSEVLVGEVTSVDEVFGLNEGNESSIARAPTTMTCSTLHSRSLEKPKATMETSSFF